MKKGDVIRIGNLEAVVEDVIPQERFIVRAAISPTGFCKRNNYGHWRPCVLNPATGRYRITDPKHKPYKGEK